MKKFLVVVMLFGMAIVEAQGQSTRIGMLGPSEEPRFSEIRGGLRQGLRDQGYTEQAVEIHEVRVTRGERERSRSAIQSLLGQRIRVLVVIGSELAKQAREVSADLPIVYITPGDPVEQGLAASLARPGANTTAMTLDYPELSGKRLELLKEMRPQIRRVLIFFDPLDSSSERGAAAARAAAPILGLTLVEREVRRPEDVAQSLGALATVDAFLAIPGGAPTGQYAEIARAAISKRVPTMFHARTASTAEALATYGTSDAAIARQLARYVAKILQGTKAGDLPVERPATLELVINLKVAGQLGLTIPATLRMRADRILQ